VKLTVLAALLALVFAPLTFAADPQQWVTYEGQDGPGKGKHIVLVSGDEEYRSEEGLPMLAKLLAKHHGFTTTVLFAIDPATGEINPNYTKNIPGLEALDSADLMIIQTRFRALPDDQMKHVDAFLKAGKPVIGLRTATHAFSGIKGSYEHYNWNYKGEQKEWSQGFGRLVLGETWINHHGSHMNESTRARFAEGAKGSPLLNGINDGDIWGSTDVYGVRLPMPDSVKPLLLGQSVKRGGPKLDPVKDKDKPNAANYGMSPDDKDPAPATKDKNGKQTDENNPMMPIAWTKSYQLPDGKPGKSFTTTMGASTDLANEALRRLLVNATYFLLDMKVPEKADVSIVGDYQPSAFRGNGFRPGMKPADFK
jgi:hypothetical protein